MLLTLGCGAAEQDDPAGPAARVSGPGGWSYALPARWEAVPAGLRWTDGAGQVSAALSGAATFDAGYAAAGCDQAFSARAVVGFARGRSHADVVRRFVQAVGGTAPSRTPTTWRTVLPEGVPALLTRTVVDVAEPGPCRPAGADLAVLTPQPTRDADGPRPSWVVTADLAPGAPAEADLAALAAGLRED